MSVDKASRERARQWLEKRYTSLREKFAIDDKSVVCVADFGDEVERKTREHCAQRLEDSLREGNPKSFNFDLLRYELKKLITELRRG